jgi:hypothetical protein
MDLISDRDANDLGDMYFAALNPRLTPLSRLLIISNNAHSWIGLKMYSSRYVGPTETFSLLMCASLFLACL